MTMTETSNDTEFKDYGYIKRRQNRLAAAEICYQLGATLEEWKDDEVDRCTFFEIMFEIGNAVGLNGYLRNMFEGVVEFPYTESSVTK
ncbi:hypothetical protein ACRQ5Q_06590 [Bradyrhizobium sp. PMVTL-01]|uniref:hypothetical protein n=1 Tax=Bradyrhizobium sp. PMVTL-01 TaxID=3434999 RepID=UPI003F712CA7